MNEIGNQVASINKAVAEKALNSVMAAIMEAMSEPAVRQGHQDCRQEGG
jgi:hypothetical protein